MKPASSRILALRSARASSLGKPSMWWKNVTSSGGLKLGSMWPTAEGKVEVRVRLDQARHDGVARDVDDGVAGVQVGVVALPDLDDAVAVDDHLAGEGGAARAVEDLSAREHRARHADLILTS